MALREDVIALLKQCGLNANEIREGGGEVTQDSWSSKNTVVHQMILRNTSMDVLMSAMAKTERHFAGLPRSYFGGIKYNFIFDRPRPVYSTNLSAEDALQEAIESARETAGVIADASGLRLGPLISVIEQHIERRVSNSEARHGTVDNMAIDFTETEDDSVGAITYTDLPHRVSRAARRFNVRYAAEEIAEQ